MTVYKNFFLILGITTLTSPSFGQQGPGDDGRNITGDGRRGNEERGGIGSCLKVDARVQTCPDERIYFTLFNRRFGPEGLNISAPLKYLPIRFKPTDSVKVILHGLIIEYMTPELFEIKNDYLKKADCSVIFVHYESYTDFNCYAEALENIKHVGSCVAKLLSEFIFELGVKDIHLIAYSLGGHVANYIAKSLHPHKLPRITALDAPALFVDDEFRLDQSDAEFVDAFYTSALNLGQNRGHAAFYFNGGFIQPGCYLGMCSHSRAVEYYRESILSPEGFYGTLCDSYFSYLLGLCSSIGQTIAGDGCPSTAKGYYYVTTNNQFPFAQGRAKLRTNRDTGEMGGKAHISGIELSRAFA